MNSGLYTALLEKGLLVPHAEAQIEAPAPLQAYKVIKPDRISFISYPYEWCFNQLKDAALCTLKIQKIALEFGMSLKDCSAYNMQFANCRPILIDTLSFEQHREGRPWVAYGQFCRHFLGPLALMSYRDVRLNSLLKFHLDGIPLDYTGKLLPRRTYLKFSLLTHIHLHAKSQNYFSDRVVPERMKNQKLNQSSLSGIIESLESAVRKLKVNPGVSDWTGYYQGNSYTEKAFRHKKEIVTAYLNRLKPSSVWDLGANTGVFSYLAASSGAEVISFDSDPSSVETNYSECLKRSKANILPLLIDFMNPSPRLGWAGHERMSLVERGPVDTVMALALLHHLAIGNNLPLEKIAGFLHSVGRTLIIEFIPKQDPRIQRMLSVREDIFTDYSKDSFEKVFSKYFTMQAQDKITDSERILYLMNSKQV